MSKEAAIEVLKNSNLISLASIDGDAPAIRIIDAAYDEEAGTYLFAAHARSAKNAQFEANANVAFTTIPKGPGAVVRTNKARIAKSDKTVDDIKDALIAKRPTAEMMLQAFGDNAVVYEISFDTVKLYEHGKDEDIEL